MPMESVAGTSVVDVARSLWAIYVLRAGEGEGGGPEKR